MSNSTQIIADATNHVYLIDPIFKVSWIVLSFPLCSFLKDEFAPIGLAYNVEFVQTRGLYINDMKKIILHYKTLNN